MQEWQDEGFVLSRIAYGETAAVVQLLTRDNGRCAGLVHGGQSTRKVGILQTGNRVEVIWTARLAEQLGRFSCELLASHAARLFPRPDSLWALSSAASMLENALPERTAHPECFDAFGSLLEALEGEDWSRGYLVWEENLLSALGYGLPRECREAPAGGFLDIHEWKVVTHHSGDDRCLPLPPLLWSRRVEPSSRRASLEALEFLGGLFARCVFHPAGHDLPHARRQLQARFAA